MSVGVMEDYVGDIDVFDCVDFFIQTFAPRLDNFFEQVLLGFLRPVFLQHVRG
jgi:hypothetical protein